MTTGFACTIVNATGDLIVSGYLNGYYAPDNTIWGIINRVSLVFDLMSLIICGASLCMISKGEGRYPDRSIGARRIFIVTGILVVAVGLTRLAFRFEFSDFLPYWLSSLVYRLLSGPWIPLIFAILVGACAIDLGKRSGSRSLLTMSHPPIYVTVIGFWVWLLNLQRFFPPLRSIVWEWAYPLSMIVVLVMMIRVLLQSSREAEENWATEA